MSGGAEPISPSPDPAAAAQGAPPPEAGPERPVIVGIRGLTKAYDGKLALDRLDLEIREGEIFGYIGPNGAGKTTTLRILAALLLPTRAGAEIAGVDVVERRRGGSRSSSGYMPDSFGVYENMTLWEYLDFFAAAYRIPRVEAAEGRSTTSSPSRTWARSGTTR